MYTSLLWLNYTIIISHFNFFLQDQLFPCCIGINHRPDKFFFRRCSRNIRPFNHALCLIRDLRKILFGYLKLVQCDRKPDTLIKLHDPVTLFDLSVISQKAEHTEGNNFAMKMPFTLRKRRCPIIYAMRKRTVVIVIVFRIRLIFVGREIGDNSG